MGSVKNSLTIDLDEDQFERGSQTSGVIEEDAAVSLAGDDSDIVDEDENPLDKLPAHAIKNLDGSVTLPLKFPKGLQVRKNGNVRTDNFDSLTFHRLTGADQRAIASSSDEMMSIVAFARSTRVNQAVMNALFDKMDAADITAGGQVLNSFIRIGRTTGR